MMMIFIMMNKMCKNHKNVFVTELIFSVNPKAKGKILLGFCGGNQGDANV